MKAIEKPIFTSYWDKVDGFVPRAKSTYIFAESIEDRSRHVARWERQSKKVLFVRIRSQDLSGFDAHIDGQEHHYMLRSKRQLSEFMGRLPYSRVYLDVTGLDHSTWAPLSRVLLCSGFEVVSVYVEPFDYRPSAIPTEDTIFDLSERIQGISPLPGFISLADQRDERVCFVPMLGFEGARFAHLLERVQPLGEKIVPVLGVPGFRPEYPFHAYLGNRHVLMRSQSWRKIRYAAANCPFSLFYLLQEIHNDYADHTLKLAPIGTKPHAIGAVLYAICGGRVGPVEIVYDHPIRKQGRTENVGRLLAYDVWKLVRHFGYVNHD